METDFSRAYLLKFSSFQLKLKFCRKFCQALVKIPAQRGKLVVEVYDHDVIGSNDLIGCTELDLGPLLLEETSRNILKLRESLTKPENEKLGTLQFTLRVAPFDESGIGLLSANQKWFTGKSEKWHFIWVTFISA